MNEEDKKALRSWKWWLVVIILSLILIFGVFIKTFCVNNTRFFGAPATGQKFWIWERTPNTSCFLLQGKFVALW